LSLTEAPAELTDALRAQVALRRGADAGFFEAEAERLALLCHLMAERFARGGRLLAVARSPAARSDALHVAVEFVHPVIVGKRALPGLALTGNDLRSEIELLAGTEDIVMGFAEKPDGAVAAAIGAARERGCLTVSSAPAGAEWEFEVPSQDPYVRQELVETLYHLLWELVHVFFEHRGLLSGRPVREGHDAGASSFLYPFLAEQERDLDSVLADVRHSVGMKAAEIAALRERTLVENSAALATAALALRERLQQGGALLALGNGGSATDAADVVADFRYPAAGERAWAALDLAADPAVLTAIANDIGADALFSRQVIAYGQGLDTVLALSTSGNSANVILALEEARRRGLMTIALVGYDGGRIAGEALGDYVIVTRSEYIPRIQEAQASAYHALRSLVG
jgi:D-sedoheptulose 7-phosphate isomerase